MGAATTGVPTPTPPNRPAGAPIAEVHDAVQEFLTDWLVRRDVDEALGFFSDRAYACMNVDDDREEEALDTRQARETLSELMSYAADELGRRNNLTEAVVAVPPITPGRQLISHPYEREFIMASGDAAAAAKYLCGQEAGAEPDESTYYGVLFRFRQKGAAALGLLWTQEAGAWRLVSYQVFEM